MGVVRIGPRSGACGDVSVLAIPSVDLLFSACLATGVLLMGPTGPGDRRFDQYAENKRFSPVRIVPGNVEHEGPSRTTVDLTVGGILCSVRLPVGLGARPDVPTHAVWLPWVCIVGVDGRFPHHAVAAFRREAVIRHPGKCVRTVSGDVSKTTR